MIKTEKNLARFFTENRHISWVLLVGTVLWLFYRRTLREAWAASGA